MSCRRSEQRSEAWKYFTLVDVPGKKKTVKCTLCQTHLKYSGSTSSMKNHLKLKHASTTASEKGASQAKLTFGRSAKSMSKPRWQKITRAIVEFCATDLRPLSIVNGQGFKNLIAEIEPAYKVPSHTTIRNYAKFYYNNIKGEVIAILQGIKWVALTTDTWTSCATEGYITLTIHYLDSDWNLHHGVLCTKEITGHHTGEHLADILREVLGEFKLPESKVAGIATDNAANIVLGIRLLKWVHLRCFGHTLQLSVNAGLKLRPIQRAIGAARRLVTFFRKSTLAANELKARQEQLNLATHPLIQDVETRWNSTYYMFKRLLEQRLAVFAVLHDSNITSTSNARMLELADDVWRTMEDITPVLKPLEMATTVVCSEVYPTLSMVYPIVAGLLDNHLTVTDADSSLLAEFKTKVSEDLKKRYNPDSEHLYKSPHITAAALDPRYKSLRFLPENQQEAVWNHIIQILYDEPKYQCSQSSDSDQGTSHTTEEPACGIDLPPKAPLGKPSNLKDSSDAMHFLMGDYFEKESDTEPYSFEKEVNAYHDVRAPSQESSSLDLWRQNGDRFPGLKNLASKFLCLPGTSVPSERIFSVAGNIVTKKRASLDPDTVDEIIFIRENFRDKALSTCVEKPITTVPGYSASNQPTYTSVSPTETVSLPPLPSLEGMEADEVCTDLSV